MKKEIEAALEKHINEIITTAVEEVQLCLDIIGYEIPVNILRKQATEWYNNTDMTDPTMIAAAVMEWGGYTPVELPTWAAAFNKWFGENFPHRISPVSVYEDKEDFYLGRFSFDRQLG